LHLINPLGYVDLRHKQKLRSLVPGSCSLHTKSHTLQINIIALAAAGKLFQLASLASIQASSPLFFFVLYSGSALPR